VSEPAAPADAERPFFGQPFGWLFLAVGLALVPVVAAVARTGWPWQRMHPAVNAVLNGTSGVFLIAGGLAIRARSIGFHRRCMLAAVTCSTVFLVSYITRFAMTGAHRYPGHGAGKTFYLILLLTHTVMAVTAVPLVLRSLWLALAGRFDRHPRIARYAYPVWLYVSLTGVVVYVMLYHVA
jgi:putative membrane protein